MAQETNNLPQYYGQQLSDGTMVESTIPPHHERPSTDSNHELLRLPVHPHPAHLDFNPEPISPVLESDPNNAVALGPRVPSARRPVGHPDPFSHSSGGRAYSSHEDVPGQHRKRSHDFRNVPPSPANHRAAYVEDYSDEEDDPRYHRRRPQRQRRRPPVSYENYYDQNLRYGTAPPRARVSIDAYSHYTPTKPEYHMHYGSDDDENRAYRHGAPGNREPPRNPPPASEVMRLPWAVWMGSNAKNHFVAFVGEFVGTTMFLLFAFSGTQVANIGSNADSADNTTTGAASGFSPIVLLYIALVFSFSLMVNVWVFFRISGGLFNPAVTFAMLLCRALSPLRASLLLAAQISGSIFASYLVSVLFPTDFNVRTTLGQGTSLAQGVFIETILTAELVFTIFMLAKEKHKATFIAPVGIGLALFIAELVGVYYTGGSLNPARSFGPCVVTGIFDKEHWIYWVGPAVGAIIAVVFYKFIKILEYEVANPGQDDDDKDLEIKEEMQKEGADLERGSPRSLTNLRATHRSLPSLRGKSKGPEANGFGG